MKIVTIVGARPQFIKAATVSRAIAARPDLSEIIVHTGQHYDANMSDVFFEELDIPSPNYNLGIGGGRHGQMTGRQLEALEEILIQEQPDWVLVYGDTNSTLAGALAAAKLHVPIAHVEAGLRSFNRRMPEEINRVLTDHLAELLFAPTAVAVSNLHREGLSVDRIRLVGDVMYDAAMFYQGRALKPLWMRELAVGSDGFMLATVHRAENTDDPERLRGIFHGLSLAGMPVVLPLHPRTHAKLEDLAISVAENIMVQPPVSYLEMAWLESNARLIATDSGGVQKEAYFHGKPCITLRDETEWVELVDSGWNVLAGHSPDRIRSAIHDSSHMPRIGSGLYGKGDAAALIVDCLENAP